MKFVRGPSATSGLRTPDVVRMNVIMMCIIKKDLDLSLIPEFL